MVLRATDRRARNRNVSALHGAWVEWFVVATGIWVVLGNYVWFIIELTGSLWPSSSTLPSCMVP